MSQRYILTTQTDVSDGGGRRGSDLLGGSYPIRVIAYKADSPLPLSAMGMGSNSLNHSVELHIGEREKIGQGTFG